MLKQRVILKLHVHVSWVLGMVDAVNLPQYLIERIPNTIDVSYLF